MTKTAEPGAYTEHNKQQRTYFETSDKPRMIPTRAPHIQRQVTELIGFAGIRPDETLLEIGCGMGRYTLELLARGYTVEGLDLSPVLLERLRGFLPEGRSLPLHCGDLVGLSEALSGRFDRVIGFFTLHHLHSLEASFSAMNRMLKPGGTITFLEPNAYNPLYYVQVLVSPGMTWAGDRGIVDMTRSKVFGALERAGFEDCTLKRFGRFPPFLANNPWGRRAERIVEKHVSWTPVNAYQLFRAQRADDR